MGFIFTTQGTQRVLDTLNTAFDVGVPRSPTTDPTGLFYVRDVLNTKGYLNGNGWSLHRLAKVLQINAADQSSTPTPPIVDSTQNARWIYFLRKFLHNDNPGIHNRIRNTLTDAILNNNSINKITFAHLETGMAPDVVIFDALFTYIDPVTNKAAAGTVRHITLVTVNPNLSGAGSTPDYGQPDPNEPGSLPNPPWRTG
jgi:hypothetical protein